MPNPTERNVSDAERDEIAEAAVAGLESLGIEPVDAAAIVAAIESHARARRVVKSAHDQDVFQLGALFAHCCEEALGWELVGLEWESLGAHGVATLDRSLVILPFLAVAALFERDDAGSLVASFERLQAGEQPPNLLRDGYAVLLP